MARVFGKEITMQKSVDNIIKFTKGKYQKVGEILANYKKQV